MRWGFFVLAFVGSGMLLTADTIVTLPDTFVLDVSQPSCAPTCDTFEYIFPAYTPYALDNPTTPPLGAEYPGDQLNWVEWTFTDGNPADSVSSGPIYFTGSYDAPDLASFVGEGDSAAFITVTDPEAFETGTFTVTYDETEVPLTALYDGPLYPTDLYVTAGPPISLPESSLPVEMLVPLMALGIAILWQKRRSRGFGYFQ